jgi:hypothetical protein
VTNDVCPRHRVKLGAAGCPLCAHERAVLTRPPRWSSLFNGWLLVPLFLAAAWISWRWAPLAHEVNPAAVALDPAPYRPSLEAMEAVLYAEERLGPEAVAALRAALGSLSAQMRTLGEPERQKALGVVRFAEKHKSMADSLDVAAARHEWELLRRNAFAPADWFRQGGAALDQAQSLAGAHGIPPDAARYAETLEGLRIIMARVDSALAGWPEDAEEIDMSTDAQWESARAHFKTDLERMRAGFPARHTHVSPGWRKAHDDLEEAARVVERILSPYLHSASLRPSAGPLRERLQRGADAVAAADASVAQARAGETMPP